MAVPTRSNSAQFSSVNFAPGPANPNLAFVTVGADGQVCYDSDGATAHVILDLAAIIPLAEIRNIEPERLIDNRASGRRVAPRSPLCLIVASAAPGGVALINITNPGAAGVGYGALRSSDTTVVPSRTFGDQFSSVNFAPGPPNPNLAFVTIGSDGRICYDSDGASAHVVLDLAASFPAAGINNIAPQRLVDTRTGEGIMQQRQALCLAVPGATPGDAAVINITNPGAETPIYQD